MRRVPPLTHAVGAALPLLLVCGGCGGLDGGRAVKIRVAGAQIAVELTSSWLAASNQPRFALTPISPIYLSQHGFEALLRGDADIACTDRELSAAERARFGNTPPTRYTIAYYGFGLYVNRANTIDALFAGHLGPILQKQITDWKELGGPQGSIHLYGPPKSTRGGELLSREARIVLADATWQVLDSTGLILRSVAEDPGGLGFAPLGYEDERVRCLGLRMTRTDEAVPPSLEDIESGAYGLAKVIYVYGDPADEKVRAVVNYLRSEPGQRAIISTDVTPFPVPAPSR